MAGSLMSSSWRKVCISAIILVLMTLLPSPVVPNLTGAEQKKPLTYIALGDSLTAGLGATEVNYLRIQAFVPRLTSYLRNNYQVYVENHGIPGLTSAQLLLYLQQGPGVHQKLQEADLITLTIGGNDLLQLLSRSELSSEQIARTLQQFGDQLEEIIGLLRQHNQKAIIYIMGLYSPYDQGHPLHEVGQVTIKAYNQLLIEKISNEANVHYISVFDAFNGQGKRYTHIQQNDIHPNDQGYEIIFEEFRKKWR